MFALNNFVQPLQTYLDDGLFFDLDITRFCGANFFIEDQTAELEDSFFQLGQKSEVDFYEVVNVQ